MRAEDMLPDNTNYVEQHGVVIRKGSVGAFLVNARVWMNPHASSQEKNDAGRDIVTALPALRALGLFEVLGINDAALKAFVERH